MAIWPANAETNWNTKMLAYLAIGHETDGTHGTKSGFQDRGDPGAYDWTEATLTEDNAWHDLDLSGIVAAGAKAVLFKVVMKDGATGTTFDLRENGNANAVSMGTIITQVSNVWVTGDLICACDSDRKVEYKASAAFDNLNVLVKGWWI